MEKDAASIGYRGIFSIWRGMPFGSSLANDFPLFLQVRSGQLIVALTVMLIVTLLVCVLVD